MTFLLGTIFLVVAEFLYGEKEHGIWLFPFAFVLLMFGAHCFDKISDIRKEKIAITKSGSPAPVILKGKSAKISGSNNQFNLTQ